MHKIIVERPRYGGGRQHHKRRANVPLEDRPKKESMLAAHSDRKSFGENLAPLRRWLRAQVGRPWNVVYSEACQVIKPDSTVRNHIKVHLLEMIEQHTFMQDDEIWCFRHGWWRGNEVPVSDLGGKWVSFYVHPGSGLLLEVPPRRRGPSWIESNAQKRAEKCRWLNDEIVLLKIKGFWFECRMQELPAKEEWHEFDLAQHRQISFDQAKNLYGRPMFCVGKRQLSHRDMRFHELCNDILT